MAGRLKINNEKYEYVLKVWDRIEIQAIKKYHDLQLKCDVLLLADVFERFRNGKIKNDGLCPSHFF